jgi:hypothetical protein
VSEKEDVMLKARNMKLVSCKAAAKLLPVSLWSISQQRHGPSVCSVVVMASISRLPLLTSHTLARASQTSALHAERSSLLF